jgi:hypothetical protein
LHELLWWWHLQAPILTLSCRASIVVSPTVSASGAFSELLLTLQLPQHCQPTRCSPWLLQSLVQPFEAMSCYTNSIGSD